MDSTGAYDAERASALSGVPKSTIHYWARTDLLVPSISTERVKLWAHADLVALRVIYWLRRTKTASKGGHIPATSMRTIRSALKRLRQVTSRLEAALWIDESGKLYMSGPAGPETVDRQLAMATAINLIAPFSTSEGTRGPDLLAPRSELRIVPGKLSGSPHIVDTRLETRALYALMCDGLAIGAIAKLYPFVTLTQIEQALDLERQLSKNLALAA